MISVSYETIDALVMVLFDRASKYNPDIIIGIARGGLFPAVSLSYKLNRPLGIVYAYDGNCRMVLNDGSMSKYHVNMNGKLELHWKALLVDDICDEGKALFDAMNLLSGMFKEVKPCVLYMRNYAPSSLLSDSLVGMTLHHTEWIKFPWE